LLSRLTTNDRAPHERSVVTVPDRSHMLGNGGTNFAQPHDAFSLCHRIDWIANFALRMDVLRDQRRRRLTGEVDCIRADGLNPPPNNHNK
jgi:hypothetical protein